MIGNEAKKAILACCRRKQATHTKTIPPGTETSKLGVTTYRESGYVSPNSHPTTSTGITTGPIPTSTQTTPPRQPGLPPDRSPPVPKPTEDVSRMCSTPLANAYLAELVAEAQHAQRERKTLCNWLGRRLELRRCPLQSCPRLSDIADLLRTRANPPLSVPVTGPSLIQD